jgi:acetyl-CoA carboxylase carboxyl transferase subunit alpha
VAEALLPFEKKLAELETRAGKAENEDERQSLQAELERVRTDTYAGLSAWERVQFARHPRRPRMLDFTSRLFEDFVELHGDRAVGDDPAMVCGIARFRGETVFVAGHQKGVNTDEKVRRNFGMAHPEGYRKAQRVFELAERLGFPIVTFVDTPAAHPGIEAEQRGQGYAIARNLAVASGLKTPVYAVILSEGGSGGALAVAVGDHIAMFEHAVYMICPPERCAEILWRDAAKREDAAGALRVTATDLRELGVIDEILMEANGGAHKDPDAAAAALGDSLAAFLAGCKAGEWNAEKRSDKFRAMGRWAEEVLGAGD